MERQEKVKALSDREQVSRERDQFKQRFEQLKQEHIGLRQNIERMYSEAQRQVRAINLFKEKLAISVWQLCFSNCSTRTICLTSKSFSI